MHDMYLIYNTLYFMYTSCLVNFHYENEAMLAFTCSTGSINYTYRTYKLVILKVSVSIIQYKFYNFKL